MSEFRCRSIVPSLIGRLIVGSSANTLHAATFFIVCHLQVWNLLPVQSKRCNAEMMPGLSRIMCQCYGSVARDASPTHWLDSRLACVWLLLGSRVSFFLTPLNLSLVLFRLWERSLFFILSPAPSPYFSVTQNQPLQIISKRIFFCAFWLQTWLRDKMAHLAATWAIFSKRTDVTSVHSNWIWDVLQVEKKWVILAWRCSAA